MHMLQISSPNTYRRTRIRGWGMFNGAEPIVEDPVSRGTAWS